MMIIKGWNIKTILHRFDRSICLYFLFSLIWNASVLAQSFDPKFERITVKDGLSQSSGNYSIQDKKGFMWFATHNGINKYNGYTITTYKHDVNDSTSLSHNGIIYLFEDEEGFIWVVNNGYKGLDKYNPATDNFTRYTFDPEDSTSISSNDIYHVIQDKNGHIWISTINSLNLLVQQKRGNNTTTHFKRFYSPPDLSAITLAYEDKNGRLLLFSNYLIVFDRKTHHFQTTSVELTESVKTSVAEDKFGNLLIGTFENGIIKLKYNQETGQYKRAPLEALEACSDNRNFVLNDKKGHIWIGSSSKGLFRYDETEDQLINFVTDELDNRSISDNSILSLSIDRSGILWIGTYSQGICKYDLYSKEFIQFKSVPGEINSLSGNLIAAIQGNAADELWVALSQKGGVNRILFHENSEPTFIHYHHKPDDGNSIVSNNTFSLVQRKNGDVWVGSDGGYVSRIIPEAPHRGNKAVVKRYPVHDWTFSLFEDSDSTLWGGTWGGGLWKYNDATSEFTYFRHDPDNPSSLCDDVVWAISEDSQNNLWIGGNSKGLSILPAAEKDKSNPEFINFIAGNSNSGSLSNNTINAIYQDQKGTIWLGTNGGLNKVLDRENSLANLQEGINLEFISYGMDDGLPSEGIIGVVEDSDGNIWMSTSNGISKFEVSDGTFINYSESDGLQGDEFWHNAYYRNSEGIIFFGGQNGITAFDPQKINANPFIPEIAITDFKIFNKSVKIGEEINDEIILTKPISTTSEISLSYKNNVFTIEFAALHYAYPEKNQYAYYLEGFEETWNFSDNKRSVTYTNLNPGEYTFRVKGSNNNGIWNETGTFVIIRIKPPWWQTWWFRIGSFLLGILILVMFYSSRVAQIKKRNVILENMVKDRVKEIYHKNELLIKKTNELNETNTLLEERQQQIEEQSEELNAANEQLTESNSKLSELNSMKDKIFSIIGHDLKNPINTIMGFSEMLKLKKDKLVPEKRHKFVENIYESANKTYQLLESLLNWARSQNDQIKYEPTKVNIEPLLKECTLLLREQAIKKDIILNFEDNHDGSVVYCDSRMVKTVLRNLISNAIKFTKQQGKITVSYSAQDKPGYITIRVVDSGIGISADILSKLFKIEYSKSSEGTEGEVGTGLGLALCKEFIEKNKGEIWVESEIGVGSTFSFTLPIDTN